MPNTIHRKYSSRHNIPSALPGASGRKRPGPLFVHTYNLNKKRSADQTPTPTSPKKPNKKSPTIQTPTSTSPRQLTARPKMVQNNDCAFERTFEGLPDAVGKVMHNYGCAIERTFEEIPTAVGKAVAEAFHPMQEVLRLAKNLVQQNKPTRAQSIAAVINRWALPVVQVLLGAAVVAVGVVLMEVSIMVLGATMCATGLALCVTLLAGILAPHPLDAVKEFVERKQERDPEPYKPGMIVALDGGG